MNRSATSRALETALICALLVMTASAAVAQTVCGDTESLAPCLPQGRGPIPANGALLVSAVPELTIEVEMVREDSDEPIAGVPRRLWPGLWSWTPLEQPEPGPYFVTVLDSNGVASSQAMTFIAAEDRALPVLMSAASLSQVHDEEHACCTKDEGAGEVDVACFQTLASDHLLLDPGLSSGSSIALTSQYLYRYTIVDGETDPLVLPWQVRPVLPIHKELDEYCYEVEAIDLITGVATPFPELTHRCAPLGDLAPPSHRPMMIPDSELASAKCPMPPNGFRMTWCALNESHCERIRPPLDCHYYGFVCENEAFPGRVRSDAGQASSGDRHLDGLIELVDQVNEATSGDGGVPSDEVIDAGASIPAARGDDGGCTILRRPTLASLSHMVPLSCASLALFARRIRRRRSR